MRLISQQIAFSFNALTLHVGWLHALYKLFPKWPIVFRVGRYTLRLVTFPLIRIRFRKTVSVLPFRNAVAVMTFDAVNHTV